MEEAAQGIVEAVAEPPGTDAVVHPPLLSKQYHFYSLLCAPSQYGWISEWPQLHQKYFPGCISIT
jgi:hypothetical protein